MKTMLLVLLFCATGFAQEVRQAVQVGGDSTWDARAKFLAGVPLAEDQPLAKLQQPASYRAHSAAFEKMWSRYNEHYFSPMRLWSAAELAPKISVTAPVFYFFGGPDAITPLAYFPDAPEFILGGLEPVGVVPDPFSLPPAKLESSLECLRKSTDVILSFGFFITKEMQSELAAGEFKGVTPIMLTFLAMSGCEVMDVSYFGVKQDGTSEEYGAEPREAKGVIPGVTITFRKTPQSAPQKLHYVQANVADEALHGEGGVLKWADGFGQGNVYLKAASYLLHESYFSKIRGFLLGHANSVLQDDSGIPFSFFQDGGWRVWFFGTYTGTLDLFKKSYQPKLVDAYRCSGVPLAFGTGYKWRLGQSNLLLAVRQDPPKAEAVSAPAN